MPGLSREEGIKQVYGGGGHVVILGAGASIASTFRNSEMNGKKLPSMDNFIDVVGLTDLIEKLPDNLKAKNFETLYKAFSKRKSLIFNILIKLLTCEEIQEMVYKFGDKNKFGGDTWQIKAQSLFHIYINSTNNNSFLVEIKEWRWINYKIRNAYMSESDLVTTVRFSFQKLQDYMNGTGEYYWSDNQKNSKLNLVLSSLKDNYEISVPIRKKYSELLGEFENSEEAHLIKETDNYVQYYWDFPESNTRSTYAVREVNNKLRVEWSQNGKLGDLEEFWEFDLSLSQKEIKRQVNQKMRDITYAAERNKLIEAFDIEPDLPETKDAVGRISTVEAFNIPPDIMEESSQTELDSPTSSDITKSDKKYFILSHYLLKFLLEKPKEEIIVGEYLEALIFSSYMVTTKMKPISISKSNREFMLNELYLYVSDHDTLPYMIGPNLKSFLSERYDTIKEEMVEYETSKGYLLPILLNNLYIDSLNRLNPSVDEIMTKVDFSLSIKFKAKLIRFRKVLDKSLNSLEAHKY
jgi:hypothetical protein